MLEIIKKYRYNISIVFAYTLIADLVYGVWSYSLWQSWYISLIIVIVITIIGGVVGWFWIKSIDKE